MRKDEDDRHPLQTLFRASNQSRRFLSTLERFSPPTPDYTQISAGVNLAIKIDKEIDYVTVSHSANCGKTSLIIALNLLSLANDLLCEMTKKNYNLVLFCIL